MTASARRSSSGSSHDIILDDKRSIPASENSQDPRVVDPPARAVTDSPRTRTTARGTAVRSVTMPSSNESQPRQGSSHTKFEVLPPRDGYATWGASDQSTAQPLSYDDAVVAPLDGPPLFVNSSLASNPSQSLDDYREPEAVPDLEPVQGYASSWTLPQSATWGATSPIDTGNWPPFITTEEDDEDEVDAYMPPIDKWWSSNYKILTPSRPGPGFLPPLLEKDLHVDSLYLVKINELPAQSERTAPGHVPPNLTEVHATMPSRLFYDKDEHGWRYVRVLKDTSLFLLHRLHDSQKHPPIPASKLRNRRIDCAHPPDGSVGTYNASRRKTHHYHFYRTIVDSAEIPEDPLSHLPVPFPRQRRGPLNTRSEFEAIDEDESDDTKYAEQTEQGYLLDAYVCSLCSVYVLVSPVISGVVPGLVRDRLTVRLQREPSVGQSSNTSIAGGWELILRLVNNNVTVLRLFE